MVILNTALLMPSKTIMALNISKFHKTSGNIYSLSEDIPPETNNNDLGISIIISTICTPT
jgi:hypothetical protein